VANVKNVDCSVAFVDGVDDPVDVWLTAKKQMFLIFFNDRSAVGILLQTINRLGKFAEPGRSRFRTISFNEFVNGFHVAQGALGKPNEVWHGRAGAFPVLRAPGVRGLFPRLRGLGGYLPKRRLAPL
jgi:hypothetical protein